MGKKQQKPPQTRGIEDTLSELGIDKDSTPDDAAQTAADRISEETPPLEPQGQILIPSPVEDGDDDDEEPDDKEMPRGLRSVLLPSDDDDDDDDDGRPFGGSMGLPLVPAPSAPRTPRGRARDKAPIGSGKLSKGLADKVPGADKMKVYKRINGQRWFIREFTKADLNQFTDFESFLTRYVKPTHGSGEYDLVGVDGLSRDIEVGQIRLIEEPNDKQSESSTAIGLVEHVMREQRERDEKWMARMMGGQQNPLELLNGVMALKKQIDGDSGDAQAAAAKAQADASSSTMQMMMLMMQQQQQAADRQNQLMMTLLTKPREEDPIMKLLLTKMISEGGMGGGGGALPPPPPPPAKATDGLADILTAMAAFMGNMGGGGGDDDFKEFLKTSLAQKQGDQLSIKDVIELLGVKKEGKDEFTSAIDHMAAIMNLTNNVRQQQEPGAAAGFFDALAALFANRDFAGSLAQAVRSKTDKTAGVVETRLQAEGQRIAMENRMLQRERQQLAATAAAPPPRSVPPAATEQVQKAAERVVARTGRLPELPANTYEHVNNILGAKDEAEQVGKTLAMLIYFAEFDDWKVFTERTLGMIRDGRKAEALKYLTAFFEGLAAIDLLTEEAGKGVVQVLGKHFEVVQAQVADLSLAADGLVTGEQLTAPPEEASAGG